jgi:hypothetical protein
VEYNRGLLTIPGNIQFTEQIGSVGIGGLFASNICIVAGIFQQKTTPHFPVPIMPILGFPGILLRRCCCLLLQNTRIQRRNSASHIATFCLLAWILFPPPLFYFRYFAIIFIAQFSESFISTFK